MRIVRFRAAAEIRDGALDPSHAVEGAGATFARGQRRFTLSRGELPAPVPPTGIVAIGLSDRDPAAEAGTPLPDEPDIFLKPRPAPSEPASTQR